MSLGSAGWTLPAAPGPSNQSALRRFAPGLPSLSFSQLQAVLAESERPIRTWLDQNVDYVRGLSLAAATAEVWRRVPGAAGQGLGSIAGTIQSWAREHRITLPVLSLVPHPADQLGGRAAAPRAGASDSELMAAVRGAIGAVTRGINVESTHGFARISVSGATVGLRSGGGRLSGTITPSGGVRVRGETRSGFAEVGESGATVGVTSPGVRASAGITWSGQIGLSTSVRNFNFSMSLSAQSWSMQLTFPSAEMPVDLSTLGGVFGSAESALRSGLGELSGFRSIEEVPDLARRLHRALDRLYVR